MDQYQQGHKGYTLDLGGVFKTEVLELIVHSKTKTHYHGPGVGNGQGGNGVQGHGVRKNIDDQPQ
jgi:hypothetical protein